MDKNRRRFRMSAVPVRRRRRRRWTMKIYFNSYDTAIFKIQYYRIIVIGILKLKFNNKIIVVSQITGGCSIRDRADNNYMTTGCGGGGVDRIWWCDITHAHHTDRRRTANAYYHGQSCWCSDVAPCIAGAAGRWRWRRRRWRWRRRRRSPAVPPTSDEPARVKCRRRGGERRVVSHARACRAATP